MKGKQLISYIYLGIYTVIIIIPLLFLISSSMKSNEAIFLNPWALPEKLSFASYTEVWNEFTIGLSFLNSLYYSIISCVVVVLISSMAAYGFTRLKWRFRGWFLGFVLLGLMVPLHSEIIPIYIFLSKIGIRSPRITLPFVYIAFSMPITVFILSGYLQTIPQAMEESAVIEGASLKKCFFAIILPLTKPALATVIIFDFLSIWNDFFAALIFINQEKEKTIQLVVSGLKGVYITQYSELLAATIIAIIPSVVVYILLQDKIVEGITAGSMKG
jgi:raffinose/stachyose/melibiose transport system permease protein